jgi:hypothetical protein
MENSTNAPESADRRAPGCQLSCQCAECRKARAMFDAGRKSVPRRVRTKWKPDSSWRRQPRVTIKTNPGITGDVRPSIACAECSAPFVPKRSDSQFCSGGCKQKAYRQRRNTEARQ